MTRLAVITLLIILSGCSNKKSDVDMKLLQLTSKLELASKRLNVNEIAIIAAPKLSAEELIVVINGNYSGGIEPQSGIDNSLAKNISLSYGGNDSEYATFFLYIKNNKIISVLSVSRENIETSLDPSTNNNAKVVFPSKEKVVIKCVQRASSQVNVNNLIIWNKNCVSQIIEIQ